MADDQDITPAILLQHMQGMEQRLRTEIISAISATEGRLTDRMVDVENRLGAVEKKVNLISTQIGNMDERWDDIEVVQVPKLRKAVGIGT